VILGREMVAVVSLFPIQVRPIGNGEIVHAPRAERTAGVVGSKGVDV
jgi:hypothetical protein